MSLSPTRSPAPTTALATTAQWTAAARARERARPNRLLDDPLAAELAGPEGFAWLDIMKVAAWSNGPELYPVIRTRFFDDFLLDRCHRWSVRQVVLLAAGLDARAFRLDWPSRTTVYELDLPAVLRRKERTLDRAGAEPRCRRHPVEIDLRDKRWPTALVARGYRPEQPSVWLAEGLLYYLSSSAVRDLLHRTAELTRADSALGLDLMDSGCLVSPMAWPLQFMLAALGAPGRFATSRPEALLAGHGYDAQVTQLGERGANFGRWPVPAAPRSVPNLPRCYLVRARRT